MVILRIKVVAYDNQLDYNYGGNWSKFLQLKFETNRTVSRKRKQLVVREADKWNSIKHPCKCSSTQWEQNSIH